MAAAHPFGAFVRCRFKWIGCVRRIKVKCRTIKVNTTLIRRTSGQSLGSISEDNAVGHFGE